jgi:hypothetical protein
MKKYLELFKDGFDATVAEKTEVKNWPYVGYSPSEGVVFTVIPKEEKDMWLISTVELKDISNFTYNMVDLGLSVKWADRNVGASSPEHYGSYFQWGDTNAYTYIEGTEITTEQLVDLLNPLIGPGITVDNVKDILASQGVTGNDLRDVMKASDIDAVSMNKVFTWETVPYYIGDDANGNHLYSKYNETDGLTVLEASDDAATVNMGSDWRMPTSAETVELVQNTDHYYIDLSGNIVAGPFDYETDSSDKGLDGSQLRSICFVKKGEAFDYNNRSNFIELPFAGNCFGSLLGGEGLYGNVWLSSVSESFVEYAHYLDFDSDGYLCGGDSGYSDRCNGQSVRGVHA